MALAALRWSFRVSWYDDSDKIRSALLLSGSVSRRLFCVQGGLEAKHRAERRRQKKPPAAPSQVCLASASALLCFPCLARPFSPSCSVGGVCVQVELYEKLLLPSLQPPKLVQLYAMTQ